MEEAIREAMSANATRRELYLSFRLMDYLCELGRTDAAEAIMDRWVVRHGRAPEPLISNLVHSALLVKHTSRMRAGAGKTSLTPGIPLG